METLYFYCAVIGGSLLVLQVILLLIGGADSGADADVDASADVHLDADMDAHAGASDAFFKVLSLKTLVAFLTFFGLAGLASLKGGLGKTPTVVISVAAGCAALYIVAWMMAGLSRLQSSGNIDLRNAIGSAAKVYLTIPARNSGRGKVTVAIQGRTLEVKAMTAGAELPTGKIVKVMALPAEDTFEVAALEEEE
ncbi:MAG: hypothetical protein HY812_07510 [Planctomycetes bacterium]|nr:hypothetical protein [Planctomycetota bacterium]